MTTLAASRVLLVGDIGGTKTDLALISPEAGPRAPLARAELPSAAYDSLEAVVQAFLSSRSERIDAACFDVAGPVLAGKAKVTNLPWQIDEARLSRELGIASVRLINDLEATARAVPLLQPADLHSLNEGQAVVGGAIAVIAPGTGLGEAFLTWDGSRYQAHASEGGHADFAPADETQLELLRYLRTRLDHVSFERVASGIGIPNIYAFLRDTGRAAEAPAVTRRIEAAPDRTRAILDAALQSPQTSPLCAATLDVFVSILAAEAGNLALKMLATGGVYLAGGIPPHILPALQQGFLPAFQRKGRFSELLGRMPVYVIVGQAPLLGVASYALELLPADSPEPQRNADPLRG